MINKLNNEQIEEMLAEIAVGRIGCFDGHKIYIIPVNYVYNGKFIIAHSSLGLKINIMRKHPEICFQVDEIKNDTHWKSVIAWGFYQELTDELDRYNAMKIFVEKSMKFKINAFSPAPEGEVQRFHPQLPGSLKPVIYRLLLDEKTGRYENE